jgi:hypothetical protein
MPWYSPLMCVFPMHVSNWNEQGLEERINGSYVVIM